MTKCLTPSKAFKYVTTISQYTVVGKVGHGLDLEVLCLAILNAVLYKMGRYIHSYGTLFHHWFRNGAVPSVRMERWYCLPVVLLYYRKRNPVPWVNL